MVLPNNPTHVASLTTSSPSSATTSTHQISTLSFYDNDIVPLQLDDPDPTLFISIYIDNIRVSRVMIDESATINIISSHT